MGTAASAQSEGQAGGGSPGGPNARAVAEVTEGYIRSESITNWTANRVGVWLMNTCELGQYCEMFYTARVNGAVLKDLTDEELEELGIHNRMHRKRIFTEICKQNDFELDELERAAGTPSPRQYWNALNAPRSPRTSPRSPKGTAVMQLYMPTPRAQLGGGGGRFKAQSSPASPSPHGSPKFTLGPGGTPRAWQKPTKIGLGGLANNSKGPGAKPGDVMSHTPKARPFKNVTAVNLIDALDDAEAEQKRRHAKWYANKVVEKSLIAMRAALQTARGTAVLQAEARYHGSLEAARETLMHNTRLQARAKAIEDFYSGNWRHKGVSPMSKFARRGFSVEEQVEAAMQEEEDRKKKLMLEEQANAVVGSAAMYANAREVDMDDGDGGDGEDEDIPLSSDDEPIQQSPSHSQKTKEDDVLPTTEHVALAASRIREKYAAPEGKRDYGKAGPGGPG